MAKHGFEQVKEPQIGDVILINIGADVPNHAAIYVGHQWYFIMRQNDYLSVIYMMDIGLNTLIVFGDTTHGQR